MLRKVTALPFKENPEAIGNYSQLAVDRKPIDLIIIHTEVGFRAGTAATFNNPQSHVSAHYGVNQDGSIDHFVDEDLVAYQAGSWPVNQRSIGIEHEDFAKPWEARSDQLYEASGQLVADICKFYNIPCDRAHIKKHNEILPTTECPDGLDIDRIVNRAFQLLAPAVPNPTPVPTSPTNSLNYDQQQALRILEAFIAKVGGNYEGATNLLTQDCYPAWKALAAIGEDGKPPVVVPHKTFGDLAVKSASLDVVAQYLGDTEIQELSADYGKGVVDHIKLVTGTDEKIVTEQKNVLSDIVNKLSSFYSKYFILPEEPKNVA